MKRKPVILTLLLLTVFAGCKQNMGPYKEVNRTYSLTNFNQLDMGSAFHVDVRAGNNFAVEVRGNEADVNDLDLSVRNSTFHADYKGTTRKQRYDTYFTITMPTLRAATFSGAVKSTIIGFTNLTEVNLSLSGASAVKIVGSGATLESKLSGASTLESYDFPVTQANLDLSGASTARVRVQDMLTVKASGASNIRYRGTPRVNSNVSGASTIVQE